MIVKLYAIVRTRVFEQIFKINFLENFIFINIYIKKFYTFLFVFTINNPSFWLLPRIMFALYFIDYIERIMKLYVFQVQNRFLCTESILLCMRKTYFKWTLSTIWIVSKLIHLIKKRTVLDLDFSTNNNTLFLHRFDHKIEVFFL